MLGMTPTKYRAGGRDEELRFAVGQTSLGALLAASSEKGVAAILLGDDPEWLVRSLQDARLVPVACRYYQGRRMAGEDERQIGRWKAMRRHLANYAAHANPVIAGAGRASATRCCTGRMTAVRCDREGRAQITSGAAKNPAAAQRVACEMAREAGWRSTGSRQRVSA